MQGLHIPMDLSFYTGFLHCRRLGRRTSLALGQRVGTSAPSGDMIDICLDIDLNDRHVLGHFISMIDILLMPQLTGSSVAGGSRTPHFSPTGRRPGSMARSKTYNSLVLLLMSQNGAVLQSNHLSPISRCAQTLKNLNNVQYIRLNIKREGFCEIYNVRPLAILAEEGSHSNAPGSIKIPQKCYSSSKRRVCNMSCRSHASP